jgi:hypothetical protein
VSAAPATSGNWLRQNIDKLLLVSTLVVLLASAVYLLLKIRVERNEIDEGSWQNPSRPKPAELIDLTPYVSNNLALASPYQGTAISSNLMMVSELRVSCINAECAKPIAFRALVCPFCKTPQPPHDDFDLDKDNMDDRWEREQGLNPRDPNDATLDPDNDGFSNLEEFVSKTNPFDGTSTPPPGAKLRLVGSRLTPFDLMFVAASGEEGSYRFTLRFRREDRTVIRTLGEDVMGYIISSYLPAGPDGNQTLVLTKPDGTEQVLILGTPVTSEDWEARLVSLLDGQQWDVRKDSIVQVRGDDYKVVDIQQRKAIIEDVNSGEKIDVVRISAGEMEMLRRQAGGGVAPRRPMR